MQDLQFSHTCFGGRSYNPKDEDEWTLPEIYSHPGRFHIDRKFLMYFPNDVFRIMEQVIVVRAEMLFDSDRIEYTGYSMLFENVRDGLFTPLYIITSTPDGLKADKVG